MSTFNLIIIHIINLKNNDFLFNYDNDKLFLNTFLFMTTNKFIHLNNITNNFYYKNYSERNNNIKHLFYKLQKIYHTLNNLIIRYKYKKAKIIVSTDLQLNSIKENDDNIISIYHNKLKYLFNIHDLLKLIYTSLTNSYLFFLEPLPIKNPYDNIPFGKSVLYYIYYFITNKMSMSFNKYEYIDIFLKFVDVNFNTSKYISKYEYILRECSIKNYINNSTKTQLRIEIENMIKFFNIYQNKNKKIFIHNNFPNDELIKIMKPYLHLKLLSDFSLVLHVRKRCKSILNKKLIEFQKFNPKFGRKIINFNYKLINGIKTPYRKSYHFIKEYNKKNICEIKSFMNNHLSFTQNNIDSQEDSQEDSQDDSQDDSQEDNENFNTIINSLGTLPTRFNFIIP